MSAADRLPTETYSKLLAQTTGTFRLTEVGQNTLTSDEDGIPNTISLGRKTRVPNPANLLLRASDSRQPKNNTV